MAVAGEMSVEREYGDIGQLHKTVLDWESDGSGNVDEQDFTLEGTIEGVIFSNDPAVSTPDNLYDVVCKGVAQTAGSGAAVLTPDLFGGEGANVTAATTVYGVPLIDGNKVSWYGTARLIVSNAGATKLGRVTILWRR